MSENKQIAGGSGDARDEALNALFNDAADETLTIT